MNWNQCNGVLVIEYDEKKSEIAINFQIEMIFLTYKVKINLKNNYLI